MFSPSHRCCMLEFTVYFTPFAKVQIFSKITHTHTHRHRHAIYLTQMTL